MKRRAGALAVIALLVAVTRAAAAGDATNPIVGKWKIVRGGAGTFTVARRGAVFAFSATTAVKLGCLREARGDVFGIAEVPSRTRLPPGQYGVSLGTEGIGCYYSARLKLVGSTLTGKVLYSEEDQPGGPFTFKRI